ncbi:MAG TPA: 50S ribosomal protein L29 [Acidimicrobiales bacterium]|nr:50S ribosomal protein L29 [Acidimicrobiales bacterium]
MNKAHNQELRGLADSELATRYTETRAELFNLRFNLATGQLDNNARISELRREVARIATLIREREIALHEATEANA